ncbi:MAG: hypothetical protein JJU36_06320 [Phycisphaeraceae bacterium]|nr:hypothetical protein [Phycisphaeraceae bacterium]
MFSHFLRRSRGSALPEGGFLVQTLAFSVILGVGLSFAADGAHGQPRSSFGPASAREAPPAARPAARPADAEAPKDEVELEPIERYHAERVFAASWRNYARRYVEYDDRFICFAGFDPRFPSSRLLTLAEAQRAMTETEEVAEGGRVVTRRYTPPREDLEPFIRALPSIDEPGSWGHLHSVKIESIEDDVIIATEPWLLDARMLNLQRQAAGQRETEAARRAREQAQQAERQRRAELLEQIRRERRWPTPEEREILQNIRQEGARARDRSDPATRNFNLRLDLASEQQPWAERRLRLVGFDTTTARAEERWNGGRSGLSVAIVGVEDGHVIAVPTSTLFRGLSREQFIKMLESREIDIQKFAQLQIAYRRAFSEDHEARLLTRIEANAPQPPAAEPEPAPRPRFQPGERPRPGPGGERPRWERPRPGDARPAPPTDRDGERRRFREQ